MNINPFQHGAIALFSMITLLLPAWATPLPNSVIFNAPPPPTDQGAPRGRSQGGASRGNCIQYQQLTALVPTTEGRVWGLTASAHPTFWFYLPHPLTADATLEFALQDATDQELYRTQFKAAGTPSGLIHLTVPTTAPAIESNQPYFWTLVIACNPTQPSESVFVRGTVQRVSLTPTQQRQLATASDLERSRLYASFGLWYDALTSLNELRETNPDQANAAWRSLLQQGGLEVVSDKPISSCCILR